MAQGLGWFWEIVLVKKCLTCHATMTKEETKCFVCGTEVVSDRDRVSLRQRFSTIVTIATILSAVMTVASLFTDFTPSFVKCFSATFMLGLVKKSASQMKANA